MVRARTIALLLRTGSARPLTSKGRSQAGFRAPLFFFEFKAVLPCLSSVSQGSQRMRFYRGLPVSWKVSWLEEAGTAKEIGSQAREEARVVGLLKAVDFVLCQAAQPSPRRRFDQNCLRRE